MTFTLASPQLASAACAWVLWYYEAPFGWSPMLATVAKTECDQSAQAMFERAGPGQEPLRSAHRLTNYQCFPETVDPRGPRRGGL